MSHIHYHYYYHKPTLKGILMKLSDLLTVNTSIAGQLSKIETEVVAKLAELQASIDALTTSLADAPLTDEQAASVQAVQDKVNELDAIIPDAP